MTSKRRRRDVLVALAMAATLWYVWTVSQAGSPSEWIRLQQWMNGPAAKAIVGKPSSFDWANVRLQHRPVSEEAKMPEPGPEPMPTIQHVFPPETASEAAVRTERLGEVRRLFQANWRSYRRFAWGRDALLPVSGAGRDQFGGWSATLVDSLDTLWIMGLREEFHEAAEMAARIDFGKATTARINVFETNIRYLGGLLAAYDLSRQPALLAKAVELGDLLYGAFNTVNGMPVDFLDLASAKKGVGLDVEARVVAAAPGTLSLELTRLSQLTGDAKYHDAAAAVMAVFSEGQNRTLLPGAWPMYVSMRKGDVVSDTSFTLGGSVDSLYEYLPKMYQLLRGGGAVDYRAMFTAFSEAASRYFLFRPMLPAGEDVLLPGNVNVEGGKAVLDPETEHLACFLGGLLLWGGVWKTARDARPEWKPHLPLGFTHAKDPRYLLRPEAIESVFYMWRVTGRQEFREAAWDMFLAVSNGTRTDFANAAVLDVTRGGYPLEKEDYMESFWLAETLKYFYLVFSLPEVVSLDEFVFNTEAHPLRVPV
ncbi:glycoside hydrolase family 47 protein [Ophiocordyceps camponoti-floridani]|uniref:alpha-1,2-Mannosidase n=1 Tax=Ophiocordyceps camponoti-floridani TaxID=2030778 RepID=A0A8H4VD13_9HYPO|nr:glycoside hydrolase family 47 protein [Ophiocordyceps camponoti-floridani]